MRDELENWLQILKRTPKIKGVKFQHDEPTSLSDFIRDTGKPDWVPRFQGFFSAARVIACKGEWTYLAAIAPGTTSPVFVMHQDEWAEMSPAGASIGLWLGALAAGRGPVGRGRRLEPYLDPLRLIARTRWLARALLRVDAESRSESLSHAPPLRVWEKEKPLLGRWPHLAAYWLISHAFFGQSGLLKDALRRCQRLKHGVVVEAASIAEALDAGRPLSGKWARLPVEHRAFTKKNISAPKTGVERLSERVAFETLRRTATTARAKEAIRLFEAIDSSRNNPRLLKRQTGLDAPAVAKKLVDLIDTRFAEYIRARLRRYVACGEGGNGIIDALRKVSPDFATFQRDLETIGLKRLPRDFLSMVVWCCDQEHTSAAKAFGSKANRLHWRALAAE